MDVYDQLVNIIYRSQQQSLQKIIPTSSNDW
jgi:hypothetical protein